MLMTTDPGDLVLDPTCGSGTTAFVADCMGRRWITIDTSRVQWPLPDNACSLRSMILQLRSVSAEDLNRNPNGSWFDRSARLIKAPVLRM